MFFSLWNLAEIHGSLNKYITWEWIPLHGKPFLEFTAVSGESENLRIKHNNLQVFWILWHFKESSVFTEASCILKFTELFSDKIVWKESDKSLEKKLDLNCREFLFINNTFLG